MDPVLPRLETQERRRRGRLLFRHNRIPLRMLVPNFFTVLSLCAGLTALRMAIEQRYDLAIALVVIAALLDGVDGRLARALKAQSKFGAELDSLADFVNFGVAPAVIVFVWGLGGLPRGFGWIVALVFALAMGLRLARFNSLIDVEKPKWQAELFHGHAGTRRRHHRAAAALSRRPRPLRRAHAGPGSSPSTRWQWRCCWSPPSPPSRASCSASASRATTCCRCSSVPPRSSRCCSPTLTATLALVTLLYLGTIPLSYRRYERKLYEPARANAGDGARQRCRRAKTSGTRRPARPSTDRRRGSLRLSGARL